MSPPRPLSPLPFIPLLALVALAGCSSDPPVLTIEITTGLETGAFQQDPPVSRIDVIVRPAGGNALTVSTAPGGSFDLGEIPADSILSLEATGLSAQGQAVMKGRSVGGIVPGAVSGGVVPLFMQRIGAWARPPGGLLQAHLDAPAGMLAERYVFVTGGQALSSNGTAQPAQGDFYDLFSYAGASSSFARVARSMVARFDLVLLVEDQGASWVSFTDGTTASVNPPVGWSSFAGVAGGHTIESSSGVAYIVGATRQQGPTQDVLAVAPDGSLTALALTEPRQGAAAVWVEGLGLVVIGGSSIGSGVEVLHSGATTFSTTPFESDPTEGAGASMSLQGPVVLVGGTKNGVSSEVRRFDPACAADCTFEIVTETPLPVGMVSVRVFGLGDARLLAVGQEAEGAEMMRSLMLDLGKGTVDEVLLRESRSKASVTAAPNGTLMLLGGQHADGSPALSVEMFFPPGS